ncbi:MAG: Loki-CTERM sorting domain-containing protein [Promethearchaeota archaeon]|jgi:hypothetical protein
MNRKKIILFCSVLFLVVPIIDVKAFTHIDYINNGNYAFFLFDLGAGNSTEISVTHNDNGNFTLFLFDTRPVEAFVKSDKTINNRIFSNVINYSLTDSPYMNFTAPQTKIYYIEVILAGGGPDTYNLTCTEDLTRYYLPIIPGYPTEIIIITSIAAIGVLLLYRKKRAKRNLS